MCFAIQEIYRSIHAVETGYPMHESLADAGPSLIDLWELEQPTNARTSKAGARRSMRVPQTSPEVKLARRIQAEIKTLIDERHA